MRILIDECLNWRLGRALTGHYAVSAQRIGWSGIKNGQLLALAEQHQFDALLTGDRNLSLQQSITLPLMPKVLAVLPSLKPGQLVRIS